MKVTLINYTPFAAETLIFTKSTRLEMVPGLFEEIKSWPQDKIYDELEYMSNTIPSSWEFVDYIFSIEGVGRGFTHQFVRTRTNSYAQQSMRVTNQSGFDYVTGPSINTEDLSQRYAMAMSFINNAYNGLIEDGAEIEDARGILPTNIETNIVAKINLRTLSDMARSRSGGRTQGEYRDVVGKMICAVQGVHPWSNLFLFPKGREFFDELEEYARVIADPNERNKVLKIIDKMRKRI